MHWIAPSEKNTANAALEKRLWDAAHQFRANSGLKSQEYSAPVLGLIFLLFAIPKGNVAEKFSELFADNITQQQALTFKIQNLRRTRDLLLPRMLSGQINLKEC
jgi:hypothetical protein